MDGAATTKEVRCPGCGATETVEFAGLVNYTSFHCDACGAPNIAMK